MRCAVFETDRRASCVLPQTLIAIYNSNAGPPEPSPTAGRDPAPLALVLQQHSARKQQAELTSGAPKPCASED
eukprot:1943408-Rhodomonas_salina.3